MKIRNLSTDPPRYTVVVCLHGDEIGPKIAIERLIEGNVITNSRIKYIVANESAISQGVRFIDEDLNRSFPGENNNTHESQLAQLILDEISNTQVIDLHTTYSQSKPFIVIGQINKVIKTMARSTGLDKVVDQSKYASGGMIQHVNGISIECGRTNTSEAIENAIEIIKNIFRYSDQISGDAVWSDPTVYEVYDSIPRPEADKIQIVSSNFTQLKQGDVVYKTEEEEFTASENFCPVLMAAEGYDDIIGYKSHQRKRISAYTS